MFLLISLGVSDRRESKTKPDIDSKVQCPTVEMVITKVRSVFPSTGRIFKNC